MASLQERLQIRREPLDKWSIREQLCLASAVARGGDQNWMSVSRTLKPFGDPNRPLDWFHQKNCAAQYGALLENVDTPKRKKRTSSSENVIETPAESILKKLAFERKAELKRLIAEEKAEYLKLQEDMALLQSGKVTEEQLDQWCKEIDDEEKQKEQEAAAHAQWLKERELKKQEIERAWRPVIKISSPATIGQKRKLSDTVDGQIVSEAAEDIQQQQPIQQQPQAQQQEQVKPPISPLLTSLLKSPSHVQNIVTSSILHSAITNQRTSSTNPTIASLLNSTTNVTVSPGLQQLVSTAIGQEPATTAIQSVPETGPLTTLNANDILDDATDPLQNLKVEDIEGTILSSDDPLPEIKNDEVEVIISDLIENPEQHLPLDDNDDIISNLENELDELVNEENAAKREEEARAKAEQERLEQEKAAEEANVAEMVLKSLETEALSVESTEADKSVVESKPEPPTIDPFEFQEEPEMIQPAKLTPTIGKKDSLIYENVENGESKRDETVPLQEVTVKSELLEEPKSDGPDEEVPEVPVATVNDEEANDTNKTNTEEDAQPSVQVKEEVMDIKVEPESNSNTDCLAKESVVAEEQTDSIDLEVKCEEKQEPSVNLLDEEHNRRPTFTPEYSGDIFDDVPEVTKNDKTGKAKRDYSRTKKKEDKDIDIFLAVGKAVSEHLAEEFGETLSEKDEVDEKKDLKSKIKIENDRSNSPWTEEDDAPSTRTRRRYSTPATPSDSVPNSPASSINNYEDDREYRNWKKSVMLLYSRLATHKYASLFLKPITDDQAPGYHGLIYRPMDLQTIRKNIETGSIKTTVEFQRDVLLMFNNAIMYNKTNEVVFNMALEMQKESLEHIQILLQAQQRDVPARRETRTSEPGTKRKRVPEENVRSKKRKDD